VRPLLALCLLVAGLAQAETVQLRKNGIVVTFEYITQDEDTITVQLPGKDSLLTYKWEDLDQDWVKKNQPKIWAERQLLIKPEDSPDKKMEKAKEEEVDPFAKELPPPDLKTLVKNLAASLQDGLKGIPVASIDALCKDADIDEAVFWKAYDELKKAGKVAGATKAAETADKSADKEMEKDVKETVKEKKPATSAKAGNSTNKTSAASRAKDSQVSAQRSSENKAHEEAVKKDLENDVRAFNGLGYLRMLTENGPRARLTWGILRRAMEDRRTLVANLRKYETQAGQIADKAEIKDKGEALSLKKTIGNAADSLEKVTRESTTMDGRLQGDCQSLLLKITPYLGK
jgi:DNA-binding transcriptional regulator YhcF (GntR family)